MTCSWPVKQSFLSTWKWISWSLFSGKNKSTVNLSSGSEKKALESRLTRVSWLSYSLPPESRSAFPFLSPELNHLLMNLALEPGTAGRQNGLSRSTLTACDVWWASIYSNHLLWLQASVWKMRNLVTNIDSNSNSQTLKCCNIFQVTMHIHTISGNFYNDLVK